IITLIFEVPLDDLYDPGEYGNHRRQALINIRNDEARRKLLPGGYDIVKVHVYKRLTIEEARRLGLLMQMSSKLVSPLGFGDKIKLCQSFLINETNKRSITVKVSVTSFGTQKQLAHSVSNVHDRGTLGTICWHASSKFRIHIILPTSNGESTG
uniref:Uncharacterized protein n=1 Tax=Romanomermis culicivorax TaxID=13658 RepID=A0A915ISS4_ROMCU